MKSFTVTELEKLSTKRLLTVYRIKRVAFNYYNGKQVDIDDGDVSDWSLDTYTKLKTELNTIKCILDEREHITRKRKTK